MPTTAIRDDCAFWSVKSRSMMMVRPASTASTDAFTDAMISIVRGPMAGRSKRRSC